MNLLRAGVDIATIALWLGHADIRATQIYLHADLALKERALARTAPPNIAPGRYRPPDTLLAFLEAAVIMPSGRTRPLTCQAIRSPPRSASA